MPDLVAKPLVRSVSMKPGEQLVLVIFGNLNIFTFKSNLESKMIPLPQFYCVAVDGSLAQPILAPVALRPTQHKHQQTCTA